MSHEEQGALERVDDLVKGQSCLGSVIHRYPLQHSIHVPSTSTCLLRWDYSFL